MTGEKYCLMIRQLLIFALLAFVESGHYKGGLLSWKVEDPYATTSTVVVLIYQQHSWTLSRFACTQSTINNLAWYNDGGSMSVAEPFLNCYSASAACTASLYTQIRERTYCTDFSTRVASSTGALIKRKTLSRNTDIIIGFSSAAWASEIKRTNTSTTASTWRVVTRIDLTKNYPINTSPVTGSLPIVRVIEGRQAVIQVPAADWDLTNDVRCRWAVKTGTAGDECGDICGNLVTAVVTTSDCTITWDAVRRPGDISSNIATSTYIAALMVEDYNSTTDTVPLSAVPLQIAIFVYQNPSGACSSAPAVIGDRPNRACIGVPIGVPVVERIVAKVYCSGDSIVEFLTVSPLFMNKTSLTQVSGTTNQWYINLLWTPTQDQKGPQVFCAAPIDQRGLTGSQHCISFVVGYSAPNLVTPVVVQGSASPLGTVFSNHSLFSIQATSGVNRPSRNGTYISIYERSNPFTPVWQTDCGYSTDCVYTGNTILFIVQNASWTYGAFYYILFDSGAASGNVFCSPESAPILDPTYWVFNIWDPGLSSTTTTTTTPPTTVTVTTRPVLTTTPQPNLTTTGIVITTTTVLITTASVTTTSATTATSVTTTTTTSPSTTAEPVKVMSAKEYEEQCVQPVAIANTVTFLCMFPVHLLGMYILFTKANTMFNPHHVKMLARNQAFLKRAGGN